MHTHVLGIELWGSHSLLGRATDLLPKGGWFDTVGFWFNQ